MFLGTFVCFKITDSGAGPERSCPACPLPVPVPVCEASVKLSLLGCKWGHWAEGQEFKSLFYSRQG